MGRRLSAIVIAVMGVVLVLIGLAQNLFEVGPAFEKLTDHFRPHLSDEAVATLRADIEVLGNAIEEFSTSMAPALSAQLEIDTVASAS